jgi:hypothetical protein
MPMTRADNLPLIRKVDPIIIFFSNLVDLKVVALARVVAQHECNKA